MKIEQIHINWFRSLDFMDLFNAFSTDMSAGKCIDFQNVTPTLTY